MAAPKKGASRRQLVILAGGGALLAVLLAIQLPGLLGGGGDPLAEPVVTASPTAPLQPAVASAAPAAPPSLVALSTSDASPQAGESQLASFGRFSSTDPFEASSAGGRPVPPTSAGSTSLGVRLGRGAGLASRPTPAPAPAPAPRPQPRPRPGSQPETGGYTVIVRSIPVSRGRRLAEAEARNVRRDGLVVRVRVSSDYSTLRPGYYIVSTGIYRTYAGARSARDSARARGYERAYARRLLP